MINIIIDNKVTLAKDSIEPLNPSKIRAKSNKDKVALIIGIEKYEQTPAASYANLDANFSMNMREKVLEFLKILKSSLMKMLI